VSVAVSNARWQALPLYVGGLMGPFGTTVILPMFPELRESFDASSSAVGLGFTIYLVPFAALLLVSGTLGERWGRRRTVRGAYLVYVAASVAVALAPTLWLFLAGRIVQGAANAFITPLLVSGLAEITPPERFGRAVGIYSSFQALGGVMAPLVGGITADIDWRWAFAGTAIAALCLAMFPPVGEPRTDVAAPRLRPLVNRRMLLLGTAAFAAAAGPIGISVVVGVVARDELGVSGTAAGAILVTGALSAMVTGPLWGRLLDRWGTRRAGIVATTGAALLVAVMAGADRPLSLAVTWALAGAFVGFVVVVLQTTAATSAPDNRGGALSFMLSFRFVGHGLGPVVWIPVVAWSAPVAFIASAALGIVTLVVLATLPPAALGHEVEEPAGAALPSRSPDR
jgi:MFS family permease